MSQSPSTLYTEKMPHTFVELNEIKMAFPSLDALMTDLHNGNPK